MPRSQSRNRPRRRSCLYIAALVTQLLVFKMDQSLDVTLHCSGDLIGRCKALQDVFYCGDSQRRHHVEIVQITQDGYLIRFGLKTELLIAAAEESHTENDTLTMLPNNETVKQLDMIVEGSQLTPATRTRNDEDNTAVVPLSENEANSQDDAEGNSIK